MHKVRDYVRWVAQVGGRNYDRAGEIIAVVPAGKNPIDYVPPHYALHVRGKPRNTISFLVEIPGSKNLYWPSIEILDSLHISDYSLLYSQKLYMKPLSQKNVDQSDRAKIRGLADLFGDAWYDNVRFLTVPAWGRRFHFRVLKGVEYIHEIESFIPAWIGNKEVDS